MLGALSVNGDQFGGRRSAYTVVNGIQCTGNESHLSLCHGDTWTRELCPSSVGVICTASGIHTS